MRGRIKRGSEHGPIVVSFKVFEDKLEIYKHVKNLKDLDKWKQVYINDDPTETQQNEQHNLLALWAYARSKGYNSRVRANCINVQDRKYTYQDLAKLVPELTLEKAKTLECLGGKGIGFQSVHSPLSNLFPCNVEYKNWVFLSAEGALQHTRAVICKCLAIARLIEFERDAYRVKIPAADLPFSHDWDMSVDVVLLEILLIKFTENTYCREALLATGERSLFEATGDRVWACGPPLTRIH